MNSSTRQHTIVTSHGSLAVEESGQGSIMGCNHVTFIDAVAKNCKVVRSSSIAKEIEPDKVEGSCWFQHSGLGNRRCRSDLGKQRRIQSSGW